MTRAARSGPATAHHSAVAAAPRLRTAWATGGTGFRPPEAPARRQRPSPTQGGQHEQGETAYAAATRPPRHRTGSGQRSQQIATSSSAPARTAVRPAGMPATCRARPCPPGGATWPRPPPRASRSRRGTARLSAGCSWRRPGTDPERPDQLVGPGRALHPVGDRTEDRIEAEGPPPALKNRCTPAWPRMVRCSC